MQTHLSLDTEEAATRTEWEAAAAAVLRKAGRLGENDPDAGVWTKLTRRTLDGIPVTPLGTAELTADLPTGGLPGQPPFTRGTEAMRVSATWDIRSHFADPDPEVTQRDVLADLEGGVTSLWLSVGPAGIDLADLPRLLAGVLLDLAPVVLDAPADPVAAADALLAVITERAVEPAAGTSLGGDPVGATFRAGGDLSTAAVDETIAALAERGRPLGLRLLVADATAVHDHGATEVQELAYSLAVGSTYLRSLVRAGLDVDAACAALEFRYAATDDQFATIAKLRAARRLWHRVAELSGTGEAARGQVQHAVTSRPMMSPLDPYVNMLRTTVATFAASVGGASSVTVLPFDAALGLPEPFSRRIARNTSHVLVAESHVAAVSDPAGGSYAVERLTDDLAHAAWEEFGRIEQDGGILSAAPGLRERIAEAAAERTTQVATRRRPITGVSEFPHLREEVPPRRPYPSGALAVDGYGAAYEAMRSVPASTPVFLATMGPVAAHTARTTFAANLFAAGGIETVVAGATSGVEDVLAGYDGAAVACLCGRDEAYADWGTELVAALRGAGAKWVVVAGRPMDGVDDAVAVGVDALAFLERTRGHLEVDA